ncbi:plus-3-domain-containing protein [Sistotremastrum suecicum HHB10207 ss-3]|uniref:Plus-3-domain-containing protein n=1 Tax=Sistotremastrum suecicum HHB10207 ss-3 TaxID=1314776 RepID=A0A166DK33_9AGAM|nr:plus-3-domain-containing protein [Sistotremastrum suecicum HHB10207 ss-3]
MSDNQSDGELTDELMALVDTSEKPRKRRRASGESKPSSKRHKRDSVNVESDSDEDPESEEGPVEKYPLEGKYIDEADRQRIMEMTEIEREELIAQRLEEQQRIVDARNLSSMLKAQGGGAESNGEPSVASAAKRKHTIRGATKTKIEKLNELKAKRKAKDERKKADKDRPTSPKQDRDSSPSNMEISSDEDGEINRDEQREAKERESTDNQKKEAKITIDDMWNVTLSRDTILKQTENPWFEDFVKGAFVRYLIGTDQNESVYRLCEITNVGPDLVKPYKVNDKLVNQLLELKHGKSVRLFTMDKISNSRVPQREYDRYLKTLDYEKLPPPTKRQLEKKHAQIQKLSEQSLSEADFALMLEKKRQLNPHNNRSSGVQSAIVKSRLQLTRNLALKRKDMDEVHRLDQEMQALESGDHDARGRVNEEADRMAIVNERNRKANLEAMRRIESAEAERKKRERKALAAGLASGTSSPTYDASARVKTLPKLVHARSRPGTPGLGTPTPGSVSPLPPSGLSATASPLPSNLGSSSKPKLSAFEAKVSEIEIDLGDF